MSDLLSNDIDEGEGILVVQSLRQIASLKDGVKKKKAERTTCATFIWISLNILPPVKGHPPGGKGGGRPGEEVDYFANVSPKVVMFTEEVSIVLLLPCTPLLKSVPL